MQMTVMNNNLKPLMESLAKIGNEATAIREKMKEQYQKMTEL